MKGASGTFGLRMGNVNQRWCRNRVADWSYKPVAATGQCFHKARIFRRVPQGLPNLINRCSKRVIKVYSRVLAPEPELKFFPGDDLTRMFQENGENLEGLALNFDSPAGLP
jgi:hypothetical protein